MLYLDSSFKYLDYLEVEEANFCFLENLLVASNQEVVANKGCHQVHQYLVKEQVIPLVRDYGLLVYYSSLDQA